ncbi:RIP metalloprotease RseP [Oleidesulfovibrio sp.]|uniref:RIP metalloprotease RseP n=1 Tax=Oleidesulfovibrio sp. TaxID=2909707 RepID=UPI003A861EBF
MVSTLSVILVLGGLIFFHELGHFTAARSLGIGVKTFSLGFGPRLFGFRKGQTDYRLALIPLGGYVQLVGEQDESDVPEGFTVKESFALRPAWHRMIVIAAGPLFNFLLAWLIYWGLFWAQGQMYLLPEVGGVQEGSPAQHAGLQKGDRILSIAGRTIEYWSDVSDTIGSGDGSPIEIALSRPASGGAAPVTMNITVTPEQQLRKNLFGEDERALIIGVHASGATLNKPMGPIDALVAGAGNTWGMIALTGQGFLKLFQRVVPLDTVGGPIMIAQMVTEQAENGLSPLLALTALISVNLGLLNLLPIPVLDGGHLLFLSLETIFRRPVPQRIQNFTTQAGLVLLLMLMVLATFNDVVRSFFSE